MYIWVEKSACWTPVSSLRPIESVVEKVYLSQTRFPDNTFNGTEGVRVNNSILKERVKKFGKILFFKWLLD
jgi:hypothetical protein